MLATHMNFTTGKNNNKSGKCSKYHFCAKYSSTRVLTAKLPGLTILFQIIHIIKNNLFCYHFNNNQMSLVTQDYNK